MGGPIELRVKRFSCRGDFRGHEMSNPEQKIKWAIRALQELVRDCEEISHLSVVDTTEARAWRAVAAKAQRAITILEAPDA